MKTKVLGAVAAASLMAGGFATLAPSSHATVVTVSTCGNNLRAIGGAKSSTLDGFGKPYGITDMDNLDVTVSNKGVDPAVNKGTNLGSCTFTGGLSTPDSSKPAVKGYSGSHNLLKWGTKLYSVESDCNTSDTGDATEWPLSGKLGIQYTDLTTAATAQKEDIAIVVDGFTDPDSNPGTPSDVVAFHGLVTKGVAVGADVSGETMFDPILKDKAQTTDTPYFGYNYDLGNAVGCADATPNNANITAFVNGANSGNSDLLVLPVAPITATIGS